MFQVSSSLGLKLSSFAAAGMTALVISACGRSHDVEKSRQEANVLKLQQQAELLKRELDTVTKERDSLKAQVENLANTPARLLAKVAEPAAMGKIKDAENALDTIKQKFPHAPEAQKAQKLVDELRIKLDKQLQEARRLEAMGFKALKTSPLVDTGEVKVSVGVPKFSKQFVFDRYESSYHYRDADRDHKFMVVGLSAKAAKSVNNPSLPGFALYWADGKLLRMVAQFQLQFVRWQSYGTYLGNYHDSGNDFAKNSTIPFTMGAEGPDELLAKRPLYVVATKTGCNNEHYERFENPPVSYYGSCDDLQEAISFESFSTQQGKLILVRRID